MTPLQLEQKNEDLRAQLTEEVAAHVGTRQERDLKYERLVELNGQNAQYAAEQRLRAENAEAERDAARAGWAKDTAELIEARAKTAAYDKWLSEGVYFTTADYVAKVAEWETRTAAAEAREEAREEALREALVKLQPLVGDIYSHYTLAEVAAAVKSANGSQLCLYGQALEILKAALTLPHDSTALDAERMQVATEAWNKGHSCGFCAGINLGDPGEAGEACRARDLAALRKEGR